jgi:lipoprotein LprG
MVGVRFALTRLCLSSLILVMILAACRKESLPELPADEIVAKAASRMSDMEGFRFAIDRSGAPAYLDPDETISFRRAEGYYVAPDRAQATVRIITPGLVTEVNVVSVGEIQWQTNIMSTGWQQLPPNWGFNPAVLFDADIGIQSILAADLSDMQVLESENLDGEPDQDLYVISGTLDGGRIFEMSYGLIGPEQLEAKMWIVPESFDLARAVLTEASSGDADPSVWQVDFSEFGRVVDIKAPVDGEE